MPKITLLIVEDEQVQRDALAAYLEEEGYRVFTAESAEEALPVASAQPIDAIISDYSLPGESGQVSDGHGVRALVVDCEIRVTFDDLQQGLLSIPIVWHANEPSSLRQLAEAHRAGFG